MLIYENRDHIIKLCIQWIVQKNSFDKLFRGLSPTNTGK